MIFGAYKSVEATTGWRRGETIGWMQMFVNPLYEGLQNKINFMWPEATLAPFLGFRSSISWVNDLIKVLAQKSAFNISELGKLFLFLSLAVYACSLLVREKQHQGCKVKGDIPDINYVSNAQKLAQSPTDKVPELIEEIKQEERDVKSTPQSPQTCLFFAIYDFIFSLGLGGEFLHGPSRGASPPSEADGNMERLELHNM